MSKGGMFGDDPQLVREWKAGYDAHNEFVLEERKAASYQDRIRSLILIWSQAKFLGIARLEPEDMEVNDIWQRLRLAHLRKSG
ncbi:MAG: hypothetical protein WCG75_12295 [Armatimonadota bacterium]